MNELVQVSFDYGLLAHDQAQRTQDAEIRIIGRTQKAIIDNGKDLLAVKSDIGHGHFLNWVQSIGISERTAQDWMSAAKNFGEIRDSRAFENRAMYLLASSKVPESARDEAKQRAESGEKITEEVARQIRDAHKAKEDALAREQSAQQQLFDLRQEIAHLSKPETVIKQVDKPETLARLEQLQSEMATLTQQRDNLSKLAEELSADLDANEAQREQHARETRVRQEWQKLTDGMYKSVTKFLGQLPMSTDTQLFESDDWARLDEVMQVFRSGIAACDNLRASPALMIVDAR